MSNCKAMKQKQEKKKEQLIQEDLNLNFFTEESMPQHNQALLNSVIINVNMQTNTFKKTLNMALKNVIYPS